MKVFSFQGPAVESKGKKRKAKDGSIGTLRLSKQARIEVFFCC